MSEAKTMMVNVSELLIKASLGEQYIIIIFNTVIFKNFDSEKVTPKKIQYIQY